MIVPASQTSKSDVSAPSLAQAKAEQLPAKESSGHPADAGPDSDPDPDPDPDSDLDLDLDPDLDPDPDSDLDPDVDVDADPTSDADARPDSDTEPTSDTAGTADAASLATLADSTLDTQASPDAAGVVLAAEQVETSTAAQSMGRSDLPQASFPDGEEKATNESNSKPAGEIPTGGEPDHEQPAGEIAVNDEPTSSPVIDEPEVPLSRRERRLAEQSQPSGAEATSASAAALTPELVLTPVSPIGDALPEVPLQRRATRKKRNRIWAALRALLLLLVIAAVVLSVGTVISDKDTKDAPPSTTELNRVQMRDATQALASMARQLGTTATVASNKKLLETTAAALQAHTAALSDGLPVSTTASSAPISTTPVPVPPGSMADFTQALTANATSMLGFAMTADGTLGRVFASASTSEFLLAADLAAENSLTAPDLQAFSTTSQFALATSENCKETRTPKPGVDADTALHTAALAEQKAVYTYQVAGSRLAKPAFSTAMDLLKEHQERLTLLNAALAHQCLPQIVPVPAYVLDPSFTTAPQQALGKLEAQLADVYGDLATLSQPSAPHVVSATSTTESSPRSLAVAWLLGSIVAEQTWGGTPGALPGISVPTPAS
ncbi:hypothetical protein GCM10025779_19460 [Arthrobacter cryoconiti]